ncbi:serine hydrolase domain-containing protein [Deinococcus radiotolerans]|uniref:Beta-lactamase-related domain-containing protein n=1 Tax=Deinococcus radiotolerans TaxID=1309407 RepID=A0ABQ2FRH2_9DEIO|nr:serine hydrolase domain-containing protein [Deinococcus radiotolerans]GGL19662.1 hypothetical protein GCM10010844_43310 [Deinococcus radiotolerans]
MVHDLHAYLDQLDHDGDFHGTVLITSQDGPPLARAYGLADRTWNVRHTPGTRFRVASIGKAFTAVAVWHLIETGRLMLDTPAHDVLDLSGTRIPPAVTVRHLLTMTAGLADWFEESLNWPEEWQRLRAQHDVFALRTNRDYLPLFAHKAPLAGVGEHFRYSNASFILLGLILEDILGRPYEETVQDLVFGRAGMTATGFDHTDDVVPDTAQGYVPPSEPDGRWRRNTYLVTPAPAADGGVTSAAADLDRFLHALRGGQLLSAPLSAQLLNGERSVAGAGTLRGQATRVGHGLTCSLDLQGQVTRVGLTGEEEGVSARAADYPLLGVHVVVLSNVSGGAARVTWDLHDLLTS